MTEDRLARRIILQCPIDDESRLSEFVVRCVRDGVSIVVAVGDGSHRIHDILDDLIVGDGSDDSRYFCTADDLGEPLEDVINMLRFWEADGDGQYDLICL